MGAAARLGRPEWGRPRPLLLPLALALCTLALRAAAGGDDEPLLGGTFAELGSDALRATTGAVAEARAELGRFANQAARNAIGDGCNIHLARHLQSC